MQFDCHDEPLLNGANVNPGVTSWQTGGYCVPVGGSCDTRYDWNCDGAETQRYRSLASCTCGTYREGWVGTVPGCGQTGTWGRCGLREEKVPRPPDGGIGDIMMLSCEVVSTYTRPQECR